jgi:hypothetical protein
MASGCEQKAQRTNGQLDNCDVFLHCVFSKLIQACFRHLLEMPPYRDAVGALALSTTERRLCEGKAN